VKLLILLLGKNGQVGSELLRLLPQLGEVIALDRHELDLCQPNDIRRVVQQMRPRLIVNAAAYTAVDRAETDEAAAQAVNADALAVLAEQAKKLGAALVHFSTDYVFDGCRQTPYEETDTPNPLNVYGKTKLAGEEAIRAANIPHLIFRTSWVYSTRGKNFLLAILRLATQRQELTIVNDQIGAPTCASDLAEATVRVLTAIMGKPETPAAGTGLVAGVTAANGPNRSPGETALKSADRTMHEFTHAMARVSGTYHVTASGLASWYDFSRLILEEAAEIPIIEPESWLFSPTQGHPFAVRRLVPITTDQFRKEFRGAAQRPLNSALCNNKLLRTFEVRLLPWRTQLHRCFSLSSQRKNPVSELTSA
jgi:dTDP-4-dehydrorhamnose reductase